MVRRRLGTRTTRTRRSRTDILHPSARSILRSAQGRGLRDPGRRGTPTGENIVSTDGLLCELFHTAKFFARHKGPPDSSILLAGLFETDPGLFLDRRAQIPGVAREEHGHAVMVLGAGRRVLVAEPFELAAIAGVEPPRRLVRRTIELGWEVVFPPRTERSAHPAATARRRRRSSRRHCARFFAPRSATLSKP